jgi:demethylmenaquinone methyltransferase/2-methoxy-6-polyprenyl-1,4-benzoquinol methylase
VIFNAFPHFYHPEALFVNLGRALKSGGRLTVAHDRGKAAIDAHHNTAAQKVSCGLMSAEELSSLMEKCGFSDITAVSTDEIYIVSGMKKHC